MKAAAIVAPNGVDWADELHRRLSADGWHVARLDDHFGVGTLLASRRIFAVVVNDSVIAGQPDRHRTIFTSAAPGTHVFVVDSQLGTPGVIAKNLARVLRFAFETSRLPT